MKIGGFYTERISDSLRNDALFNIQNTALQLKARTHLFLDMWHTSTNSGKSVMLCMNQFQKLQNNEVKFSIPLGGIL